MKYTHHFYCFKTDMGAVFLDRNDKIIKEFNSYIEALSFAKENIKMIDKKNQTTLF